MSRRTSVNREAQDENAGRPVQPGAQKARAKEVSALPSGDADKTNRSRSGL